jgi:ribonuclease Z
MALALLLAPNAIGQTATSRASSDAPLRVILLGTGVGPPVSLSQFGPSTLVEAGQQRLLFDCGRGATIRLVQAGVPTQTVTKVFLTHLHSDHVVQLPDLFLTGWVPGGGVGRTTPLEVWGPDGTIDMMNGIEKAFAYDIHIRRDIDEKFSADGISVRSHDIKEGVIFDEGGVRVTAFLVDHGPVTPAFGYRVDYAGHSVVLSGDTRVSENLVRHAQGTDVLIHEAFDAETARARSTNLAVTNAIIAHHTTPEDAGRIFARVTPRLAVYSHAPATTAVIEQTRRTYAGPLQGAEDLLEISIGAEVVVRKIGQ